MICTVESILFFQLFCMFLGKSWGGVESVSLEMTVFRSEAPNSVSFVKYLNLSKLVSVS